MDVSPILFWRVATKAIWVNPVELAATKELPDPLSPIPKRPSLLAPAANTIPSGERYKVWERPEATIGVVARLTGAGTTTKVRVTSAAVA